VFNSPGATPIKEHILQGDGAYTKMKAIMKNRVIAVYEQPSKAKKQEDALNPTLKFVEKNKVEDPAFTYHNRISEGRRHQIAMDFMSSLSTDDSHILKKGT
jgi:hypothetical protein